MSQNVPIAEPTSRLACSNEPACGLPGARSAKYGRGKVALAVLAALGLYFSAAPLTVLAGSLISRFYKPQAALPAFNLVLMLKPDDQAALLGRSESYRAQGKYVEALTDLSQVLQKYPRLYWARARRADLYGLAGMEKLAQTDLQILHKESPQAALFFQQRAFRLIYAQIDPSEIIRLSTYALAIDPSLARSYANRAQGYICLGEYARAIADASAGLALKPKLASTVNILYARRAQAYYALDQVTEAISDARAAIYAEGTIKAYINMALYCMETGRYKLAISTISEGMRKVDRIDMVLVYMKRKIFKLTGDPRIEYTHALVGFPILKLTEFFLDKADLYLEGKNYKHALISLAQAVELKPRKLTVLMARARINLAMGKYKEALVDFNTCVEQRPKLAVAYYFRAQTLRNLGQADAAQADLAQAKKLGFVEDGRYIHLLQDYMP